MGNFSDKRVVISGASRGIGLAIGKRLAADGASIAILAKTAEPHPKLPGTIYTAAEEIVQAGGRALPLITDIRSEEQVQAAVAETVQGNMGSDSEFVALRQKYPKSFSCGPSENSMPPIPLSIVHNKTAGDAVRNKRR